MFDDAELTPLELHVQTHLYLTAKEVASWVEEEFGICYTVVSSSLVLLLCCAGCAVNGTGMVAGRIIDNDGVRIADIYAFGALLRTHPWDRGVTLGLNKSTLVYPASDEPNADPGWRWFHVSLPDGQPVAFDIAMLGVEVSAHEREVGFTLGLRRTTVLARVPAGEDVAMFLTYDSAHPESTLEYLHSEEKLW